MFRRFLAGVGAATLVVCPLSLLDHWERELPKTHSYFDDGVVVYHGPNRLRIRSLGTAKVVLTTYDTVRAEWTARERERQRLEDVKRSAPGALEVRGRWPLMEEMWWRVVSDEAHTFRSFKSKMARAMFALRSVNRTAMTGTMFNNNSDDLRSIKTFVENRRDVDRASAAVFAGRLYNPQAQDWMRRFVIRRTPDMVNLDLPRSRSAPSLYAWTQRNGASTKRWPSKRLRTFN